MGTALVIRAVRLLMGADIIAVQLVKIVWNILDIRFE